MSTITQASFVPAYDFDPTLQEPEFHVEDGFSLVGHVTIPSRPELTGLVYCCGVMNYYGHHNDGTEAGIDARTTEQLIELIRELGYHGKPSGAFNAALEAGQLHAANNPWFEIRVDADGDELEVGLESVHFAIDDAVAELETILTSLPEGV